MSNEVENNKQKTHDQTPFVRWKHTRFGRMVWTLLDLGIAYTFASFAIDSGSLWQWGIAILFLIDGVYNLIRFIGTLKHGNHNKTISN